MRNVTQAYLNAVNSIGREWDNEVTITSGNLTETYNSCEITIEEVFSNDTLSMGAPFTKQLALKVYAPQRTLPYNHSTITVTSKLKVGNSYTPVQMGVFYPSDVSTSDDYATLDIVAFDTMGTLNETYEPTVSVPTTFNAILNDIVNQYQLTLESGSTGGTGNVETIYESTVAEMLGYIAGMQGKNAIFNSDGKLEFKWYSQSSLSLTRENQKEIGLQLDEGSFTIQSITSGTDENPLTTGTGKGISFYNPYMTQSALNTIGDPVLGSTYYTGKVDTFGNPAIEVGDIVTVKDKDSNDITIYCSNINWSFSGGCSSTLSSVGNPDAEIEFSSESPTEKKINKVKTKVQEAMAKVSELINNTFGYYTITEESGVPTGWTIKDDINNPQNMIKCSLGGIGISANGGVTYTTAITGEGINADTITTGVIQSQSNDDFYLDMNNGTVNMANANISGGSIQLLADDALGLSNFISFKRSLLTSLSRMDAGGFQVSNSDSSPQFNSNLTYNQLYLEETPSLVRQGQSVTVRYDGISINKNDTNTFSVSSTGATTVGSTLDVDGVTHFNNTVYVDTGKSLILRDSNDVETNRLDRTGSVSFAKGNFTVNSSGNITNCGTISSGNITSSGTIKGNALNIGGDDMAMFIIEKGTVTTTKSTGGNQTWRYRKWSNGNLEAWTEFEYTGLSCNQAFGNVYQTPSITENFPTLFTNVYTWNMDKSSGTAGWIMIGTGRSVSTHKLPQWYFCRGTTNTSMSANVSVYLYGTWN